MKNLPQQNSGGNSCFRRMKTVCATAERKQTRLTGAKKSHLRQCISSRKGGRFLWFVIRKGLEAAAAALAAYILQRKLGIKLLTRKLGML